MCSQNPFSGFYSANMDFFFFFFLGKNLKTVFGTPFPIEKVIFISVVQRPILSKIVIAPQKLFFAVTYFRKYCFEKKLLNEKCSKTHLFYLIKKVLPSVEGPQMVGPNAA